MAPEVEAACVAVAIEQPALGQVRVANALAQRGLTIPPAGARVVWVRHDLETLSKRLKALEANMAQEGVVLTAWQLAALEKAQLEKEAHGECESECPGYCAGQDTFYVLTDRGTEFCGVPDRHPFERYLAVENIEPTRSRGRRPHQGRWCYG